MNKKKKIDGEYFHFTQAIVYHQPDFTHFINMLKGGRVQFDIRIGCYRSGDKIGKAHDLMSINKKIIHFEKIWGLASKDHIKS